MATTDYPHWRGRYSIPQVAALLGVNASTIRRWCYKGPRAGGLRAARTGHQWIIRGRDLAAFLNARGAVAVALEQDEDEAVESA